MTTLNLSASGDNVQHIRGDDYGDNYVDDHVENNGVEEREKLLRAYLEYVQARRYRDSEPLSALAPGSARM